MQSRPCSTPSLGAVAFAILLGALAGAGAASACPLPVLSEVLYDAVGADGGLVFVEIYGAPGESLDGLVLEGLNGSDGSVVASVALAGTIPSDGLFVVGDDRGDGSSDVSDVDLVRSFDFQNGPDSVVLRSESMVLDALAYGVFAAGDFPAGEGTPAPDVPPGSSLARRFADVDTDDNALDFVELTTPTPGHAPLAAIPEPATAAQVLLGLAGLARLGRTRRRSRAPR